MDGPAGAGKGTLAKRLAAHLGYAYLETGPLYRAVGLKVLRQGHDPSDIGAAAAAARDLSSKDLEDPEIRSDTAANAASIVAVYPEVRKILIQFQRDFASHPPGGAKGAVIEGRDIGTVVCPNADIKFFVTASLETRANRRLKELRERGIEAIPSAVLRDMKDRDSRDSQREAAPLRMANDAILLDTTELTADQVFAAALKSIESRTGS